MPRAHRYAPNCYGAHPLRQILDDGDANTATFKFVQRALNRALEKAGYTGPRSLIGQCVHMWHDVLPGLANIRRPDGTMTCFTWA